SGARDIFEEHVATPHGLDFEHAAALYGAGFTRAQTVEDLREQVAAALAAGGTSIVEVRTDRAANVALHRELSAAVAAQLSRHT
ncbi:MAG: 2-succinyl-5-enolpyruvyl-6-hydroxy-3-cyclohexene-carboxylate synthase, partial [Solirubrobacteraceae bacterium]|nr:2-succinyl-5-enolpyruvyl-6-hydroxy-3-cyclohexene-carboxylate synthase [Solirubrobacteraceae bacterium]